MAFNPDYYINTLLRVIPRDKREDTLNFFGDAKKILRWWILAKSISMIEIGILSFIGLHFLHVNLALILAILAGVLAFIPYLGAIIASVPAILIGLTISPLTAFYVLLLYMAIHAIDGYLVSPYLELKTIYLPPGITILMQMLLATLFGLLGFALASPITVVLIAFMEFLYRRKKIA